MPDFLQWSQLLKSSGAARGSPIYFSMCSGSTFPFSVARQFANSWRMGMDTYLFRFFLDSLQSVTFLSPYAGRGGWNDLDMLGAKGYNANQSRSQFSLNALLGSPLLLSMDISSLSTYDLETYSNYEVLNISGDPLALPGVQIGGGSVSGSHTDCPACYDGVRLAACTGAASDHAFQFDPVSGTVSVPGDTSYLDLGPGGGGNPLGCYAEVVLNPPRKIKCCHGVISTNLTNGGSEVTAARPTARRNITCAGQLGDSYNGGDIRSFTNATLGSCCAACQSESTCLLWEICHPQGNSCDDMRCWLKNAGAKRGSTMKDRISMRVPHPGPSPSPPPPSPPSPAAGPVCASQRWKTTPTARDDGSVLLSNMVTYGGSKPLCLSMFEPRATGLLGVELCNASSATQSWLVNTRTRVLTKAEPEHRCVTAPSGSTGTTIWGKRLADGFAVVFFNQNSGAENITCGADCMTNLVGLAASSGGGSAVTKTKMRVRDIWRHADLPEVVDMTKGFSAVVAPGGGASVAMFKLT